MSSAFGWFAYDRQPFTNLTVSSESPLRFLEVNAGQGRVDLVVYEDDGYDYGDAISTTHTSNFMIEY